MKLKTRAIFTNGDEYSCVSVLKQTYFDHEGQENIVSNERQIFTPLQVDELKEFAPDLHPIYKAMCPAKVVKAWKKRQKEIEENLTEA